MKSKITNKKEFISPNPEITAEYDVMIQNEPEKFMELVHQKRIKTTCISPIQQKFIKKCIKKENLQATKSSIRILWVFLKNYKISLISLLLTTIASVVLLCLASFGMQQLTRLMGVDLIANPATGTSIMFYCITLISFYFLSSAMMWVQTRIMARVSQSVGYKIREQLFSKIQKLPVKYFDQHSSGDLMSKFINDVNTITDALSQNVTIILNGIFNILSMLLCMFLMSSFLSLITLAIVPMMFIPMMFVVKKAQPHFKQTQIMVGKVNGFVEEMISGQSVINLFDQSENVSKQFEKINNELKKHARKSQAATAVMFPYANFFSYFLIMIITVIGIIFIEKGIGFAGITLGDPVGLPVSEFANLTPNQILQNPDILVKYLETNDMTRLINGILGNNNWSAHEIVYNQPQTLSLIFTKMSDVGKTMAGLSTLAIFSVMTRGFLMPFAQIASVTNTLMAALAGANRAFSVFDEKDEINEFEHVILSIAANSVTNKQKADVQSIINDLAISENKDATDKKLSNVHLDKKQEVTPIHEIENATTNGSVKIENLDFSYVPEKQILFDVNIDAKEGQKIAIVGPTGSGKSTIINLLTKFYDIEKGDIKIGGDVSIKDITKHSMRKNVSIVLQDTYLFNESVRDNIRCGNLDATEEDIINAAKVANAHQFIMQLPNGYDTVFEDNGDSLSQGQRQLLAIARAVLVKSSILILDEATSSIDSKTEIEIQNAMLRLMENKTSFIIAHRLSTIENADQILVLKDGRITERGTHQELLAKKGFYYNLHNSQFYEEQ